MAPRDLRQLPTRTVLGIALALVLAVALGMYVGQRVPWGTKHPHVERGIALRANSDNDLVLFDAEDGTQLTLHADALWWETDSSGGEGNPPCLRQPGHKADVEVGYLWVAGPDGGGHPVSAWVKCL